MGDKREFLLAVALLLIGFLCAPVIIDYVPFLAIQGTITKTLLCFAISILFFLIVVFGWAFLLWLFRRWNPMD
jgi:hypothetical protein